MKDLRCLAGLHAYQKPSKEHPVSASDVAGGRLTLTCRRCEKAKTVKWQGGPPKPDEDGYFPISPQNS